MKLIVYGLAAALLAVAYAKVSTDATCPEARGSVAGWLDFLPQIDSSKHSQAPDE